MSKHRTSHDAAFRACMKDVVMARDYFEAHLPLEILREVRLATLEPTDGSFVDEHLRSHLTDILYKVKFGNEDGFLYLLAEHYTNPVPLLPIYLLSYECQIAKQYLIKHKESKKLPRIFGMVFYHGKRSPYPYSTLIEDCFVDKEFARQHFLKGFHLVDITQVQDEEIRKHKTAALMELLQKHCYVKDLLPILKSLKPVIDYLIQVGATEQIGYNAKYIFEITDASYIDQAIHQLQTLLPSNLSGEIMTIAEQLRQQGVEKTAINFLMEGVTEEIVVKATGLSIQKIRELKSKAKKN